MTYDEFIKSIPLNRTLEYKETHHIVPKCLGGGNEVENLIDLTPKEHFIAHKLLAMENPQNAKLVYAFHLMSIDGRHEVSADEYEQARLLHIKSMMGTALHSKPHTERAKRLISERTKEALARPDVRQRLSESHKNPSEEIRKKISEASKGRKHSEVTKEKMAKAHKGKKYKPMSAEGRENIRKAHLGKTYTYNLTCKVCGTKFVGTNPGFKRCNTCKEVDNRE